LLNSYQVLSRDGRADSSIIYLDLSYNTCWHFAINERKIK
jgi:hypothetical protein